MIIYCWRCPTCDRKGATNIRPVNVEICLQCGEPLIITKNRSIYDFCRNHFSEV